MAGTLRGKIDCYLNTGLRYNNLQNGFKNLYDFCVSHPNMSLIARHGGTGSTSASVDYHDGANPFLSNAWAVFRMNDATLESGAANPYAYGGTRTYPWYIYFQMTRADVNSSVNVAPASPCSSDGVTTIGGSTAVISVANALPLGSVAGTSEVAWLGAGTLGQNTKGTPVWRTTAGTPTGFQGTFVYPRSNNTGGSHSANRENTGRACAISTDTPSRQHIMADDDSIVMMVCDGDDGTAWQMYYFGMYAPRAGLSITYPMVQIFDPGLPLNSGTVYGPTTGVAPNGGLTMNLLADGVRSLTFTRYDEWSAVAFNPSRGFPSETYDEWPVVMAASETPYIGLVGTLGTSPLTIGDTWGVGFTDSNSTRTRSFFGASASSQEVKLALPWDGVTFPRSSLSRAGVTF